MALNSTRDLQLLEKLLKQIKDEEGLDKLDKGPETPVEADTVQQKVEFEESEFPEAINGALIGFILHCIFKVAVFLIFAFRGIFSTAVNGLVLNEIVAVAAVVDFWLTKNVSGKRLLGVKWYFDTDEHGTEKFFFEARANDKYISFLFSKLFWLIQIIYTFIPFVAIVGGFIQAFYVLVNLEMIIISIGIMAAGGSNLFFFFQATSEAHLKQKELKRKLTPEAMENIRFATLYSYK